MNLMFRPHMVRNTSVVFRLWFLREIVDGGSCHRKQPSKQEQLGGGLAL